MRMSLIKRVKGGLWGIYFCLYGGRRREMDRRGRWKRCSRYVREMEWEMKRGSMFRNERLGPKGMEDREGASSVIECGPSTAQRKTLKS